MRLGGKATYCTNPYELYKDYSDFTICPMGANFQMVLFKNKQGDVIAKFMLNEREVLYRMREAERQGVPFINYGLLIAHMQGIMARAIEVLPK